MWRFRGTPHYLNEQARRFGINQVLADRARHNKEIYQVSVLLAQLCERYHRARSGGRALDCNGNVEGPVFLGTQLAQIKGTLEQCEMENDKLHALAAASQAMLDEAWLAFGQERPARHFAVACDYDEITRPLEIKGGGDELSPANGSCSPIRHSTEKVVT